MSIQEVVELATLAVATLSTVILPFVLRGLNRQDADRQLLRTEIHDRLGHIDDCIDSLRARVVGETCTRADLSTLEARVEGTINRMRLAISNDTKGLHDRVLRLEDPFFRSRSGDG